jgi:hypothetical protein
MRTEGQTTVWRAHIGVGRATDSKGWYHQLKTWWAAYKAARREANLACLRAQWDARHEAVRPFRTEQAIDMLASTHAFSTTTALSNLGV